MDYFIQALKNYANFEGRARRKEFWMFQLFYILLLIPVAILDTIIFELFDTGMSVLILLYVLFMIIPNLSVLVRRLHDTNNSGWMMFISLIPFIGGIWLFVIEVTEGTVGPNKYGEDSKRELL